MPSAENQNGTFSSTTAAFAEVIPTNLITASNGEHKEQVITKVTTTYTTTKVTTKKVAIGDEREIRQFIAKPSEIPPLPGFDTAPLGEEEEVAEKVTNQQSALINNDQGAVDGEPSILFEGKIRKYRFKLFSDNWLLVDAKLSRDGLLEWVNPNDTEYRRKMDLKEVPAGLVVAGSSCGQIPAFHNTKFKKSIDVNHLIAIGLRQKKGTRARWFLAENEKSFVKLAKALSIIVGYDVTSISVENIQKAFSGEEVSKERLVGTVHNGHESSQLEPAMPTTAITSTSRNSTDATNMGPSGDKKLSPRQLNRRAKEAFFKEG